MAIRRAVKRAELGSAKSRRGWRKSAATLVALCCRQGRPWRLSQRQRQTLQRSKLESSTSMRSYTDKKAAKTDLLHADTRSAARRRWRSSQPTACPFEP